jgi:hypothetical protein
MDRASLTGACNGMTNIAITILFAGLLVGVVVMFLSIGTVCVQKAVSTVYETLVQFL